MLHTRCIYPMDELDLVELVDMAMRPEERYAMVRHLHFTRYGELPRSDYDRDKRNFVVIWKKAPNVSAMVNLMREVVGTVSVASYTMSCPLTYVTYLRGALPGNWPPLKLDLYL